MCGLIHLLFHTLMTARQTDGWMTIVDQTGDRQTDKMTIVSKGRGRKKNISSGTQKYQCDSRQIIINKHDTKKQIRIC